MPISRITHDPSSWFRSLSVLFFAALLGYGATANAQETIPGWHPNLDEARKQAGATGKPLFITFRCVR